MKKFYFLTLTILATLFFQKEVSAQINITNGTSTACSDTLYDSGGAAGDYSNSETFEYTISPTGADSVRLYLISFFIATDDTLLIYDGTSSADPLILAIDSTSTGLPASVTSSGSSITVQWKSDAAITAAGFKTLWFGIYNLSVSINADFNTICNGDPVTFTVTDSAGGGTNPTFQWYENTTMVGTDLYEYSSSALSNGDTVWVEMTHTVCTDKTANSAAELITVNPIVTPNVTVAADQNPVCDGIAVTVSVTDSSNAGDPTFAWTLNGGSVGSDLYEYVVAAPVDGDSIAVIMTPEAGGCYDKTADTSWVVLSVTPNIIPNVTISASANPECSVTPVTFTVTDSANAGNPTFAWTLNGVASGFNSHIFNAGTLSNNDSVAVIMTPEAGGCYTQPTDSDKVIMTITAAVTPNVTLFTASSSVCSTDTVTFFVIDSSNAGDADFAWTVNGAPVGSNFYEYVYTSPVNNANVKVTMTAEVGGCYNSTTDADSIILSVTTSVTGSVSVSADDPSVCAGTNVTFTASPTNGGGTPTYAWRLNGSSVGSNSPNYSNNSLSDDDWVAVSMGSSIANGCIIDSVSADSIQMNINPNPALSIGSVSNLLCRDVIDGSADANGSGGTGTLTYLWSNSETTEIAAALDSGYNVVIVTDDSSCTNTDSVSISSPSQLDLAFVVVDASGFGQSDGSVTATGTGGVFIDNGGTNNDGYLHQWSNAGSAVGPKFTTVITVGAGWYSNTITDDNGCTYIDSAFVDQPDVLTGGGIRKNGLPSDVLCKGELVGLMAESTASLGGIGTKVYTWQGSTDLISWTNFPNSDSIDFVMTDSISENVFIRRRVVDTPGDSAFSNIIFLNYIPPATVTINGLASSYCENESPADLFGSPSGGSFTSTAYIDTALNRYIPSSASNTPTGSPNTVQYIYTDTYGCVSSKTDITQGYSIETGTVACLNPADTTFTPQTVFDVFDTTVYNLTSSYPSAGTFSGTGVYQLGGVWKFEPSLIPPANIPFSQYIQFSSVNANGCVSRDSIQTNVISTQIVLTTDTNSTSEFNTCYTDATGAIYAVVPASDTVTQYRWIAQDLSTGKLYLETPGAAFTVGTFTDQAIPFPFDPKNFKPGNNTIPYDSVTPTPAGVTNLRIYFQHYTKLNPFFTNLIRDNFELVNLNYAIITPDQLNSNGSSGSPYQYCVSEDTVSFTSLVYPLGGRTTTQGYSTFTGNFFTDFNNGKSEYYPAAAGSSVDSLTLTYTDDATSCAISSTYPIIVDALPVVSLDSVPTSGCVDLSAVKVYGSPYAINRGNFTSPNAVQLNLTHINGNNYATFDNSVDTSTYIKYTYQETTGCVNSDSVIFQINALPVLSMSLSGVAGNFGDGTICETDDKDLIITGTADGVSIFRGDNISGTGITTYPYTGKNGQAVFNPSVAGPGTHTITYSWTNGDGCTQFHDTTITVNAIPNASFTSSDNDMCMDTVNWAWFTSTSLNPGYPSYWITDTANTIADFRPFINQDIVFGNNVVYNTYTDTVTTCIATDSVTIFVNNPPSVSLTGVSSYYC